MDQRITIGSTIIGSGSPAFIIAEAGVNHNGDPKIAMELVRAAKIAGADCVKFQTFSAARVATQHAPKAAYQLERTDPAESQVAMLRKLELPLIAYPQLLELCQSLGIAFLSTPYNFQDVDVLERLGVPAFKLASIHCTELPMVAYAARTRRPVLLSTGLATLDDVVAAARAFEGAGNTALVLLQATTDYPARAAEANLRAMETMRRATGALVGYSDNSDRTDLCVVAVAAGACVIEKHFTLDRGLPGPDHAASADPTSFAAMVEQVRRVEAMLGTGEKVITPGEARNAVGMKRSLVASRTIGEGETITVAALDFRRPATGLLPNAWFDVIGQRARVRIPADTTITAEMIVR